MGDEAPLELSPFRAATGRSPSPPRSDRVSGRAGARWMTVGCIPERKPADWGHPRSHGGVVMAELFAVDAWMQQPDERVLQHPIFEPLWRSCGDGPGWRLRSSSPWKRPSARWTAAVSRSGCRRPGGPDGPWIANDEVAAHVAAYPARSRRASTGAERALPHRDTLHIPWEVTLSSFLEAEPRRLPGPQQARRGIRHAACTRPRGGVGGENVFPPPNQRRAGVAR